MEATRRLRCGRVLWEVRPEWADALSAPGGLPLDELLHSGRAQIVKHGSHRTVYRLDLPQGRVYLKHYRCRSLRAAGRHLLRACTARREWIKTNEVARRRLPTARPIAVGQQHRGPLVQDNFLITEAIDDTVTLESFLREDLPGRQDSERARLQRQLADRLAELCAASHEAGVDQQDFHAGNVLLRIEAGDDQRPRLRLFLIDLPTVRFSGPLNWRRTRNSLQVVNSGFMVYSTPALRWRFWQRYLSLRRSLQVADPRAAAQEIAETTRRFIWRLVRGRDKRVWRNNRSYRKIETRAGRAHAVRELPEDVLSRLLQDPEQPLRDFRHQPEKLSHSSVVVRAELPLEEGVVQVAYKRTRIKSWWKRLLAMFRRNRAASGWRWGHALLQRRIPTARPIALCLPRGGREGYLATEWISGSQNLHLAGWKLADCSSPERRRRALRLAAALGSLVGRLHAWGFDHRDLKGCNLICRERTDCAEAFLIDLDGLSLHRRLSRAAQVRNLARLATSIEAHPWVTHSMRRRFFTAYLRELHPPQPDWKPLWREVSQAATDLTTTKRRRGDQIA